jgi:SAM-dependent methyltransferase
MTQAARNREGEPLRAPEKLLLRFCRPVDAPPLQVVTYSYTVENSLDFVKRMIPDFVQLIQGKRILDFGCGPGWQAVAMKIAGAASVDAVDINEGWLDHGRALLKTHGVSGVTFSTQPQGQYDIVISLCGMEHFGDPEAVFRQMCSLSRNQVIICFGEPWFSPYGTHMCGTTRLPWLNLIFSERTLINVRNLYPDGKDGATRFSEILGGLNKMTIKRFEAIVKSDPAMKIERLQLVGVKGLPIVTQVPVLRELMTNACTCILQRQSK